MDFLPEGFREPTENEKNPKNFRQLLSKVAAVFYDDVMKYYPGKITR